MRPTKLLRLLNSVYGSDSILLFERQDNDSEDRLLPTLLTYDQGCALEDTLQQSRGAFDSFSLAGKLLARIDFFETAAKSKLGAWEVAQRAQSADGLADAMVRHLIACGLQPCTLTLGSADEEQEAVRMRDMGANTPAAPSSVRLTAQLSATLMCQTTAAQAAAVPLGGAGDAVILGRYASNVMGRPLPLVVSPSLWEARAVVPERLPESTAEQDCSFDECRLT